MPKVYHTAQQPIQLPLFVLTKVCIDCSQEKPLGDYQRDRTRKDGYKERCKACTSIKNKIWYAEHAELARARTRTNNAKNPERKRAYDRAYRPKKNAKARERYATDAEYRAKNNQHSREHQHSPEALERRKVVIRQWAQEHPEKITEYAMRRNAVKKQVTVDKVDYVAILERDGFWCYICDGPIDPSAKGRHKLCFDHVIPLQPRQGEPQGTHTEDNIKPVHQACNSRKHNKQVENLTEQDRRGPDA